jgi:hypothetical protein
MAVQAAAVTLAKATMQQAAQHLHQVREQQEQQETEVAQTA